MKNTAKYLFIAFLIVAGINASSAKSYTLSTHLYHVTKVDSNGMVLLIQLNNTTTSALSIKWAMVSNTVANTTWAYSYCDLNTCYTSTAQIPATTTNLVDASGGGAFNLTVTHFNNEATTAMLKIALWDVNDPTNTDTIEYLIDATRLGVQNTSLPQNFLKIYPNPSTDYITVQPAGISGHGYCAAEIMNIMGQKIFSAILTDRMESRLPVYNLPKGTYFVRVRDESGQAAVQRFVKE